MKLIAEGAEARIYSNGKVVKERIPKTYRLREIDERLRKSRTRREAKIMQGLARAGLPVPRLVSFSDETMKIEMEKISGKALRDALTKSNCRKFGAELGKGVALMHTNHIIHADLTTSNMIVSRGKIFFIDFGLSFVSHKPEDKAVDLHLLRQALESKHHSFWKECYEAAIASYKKHCPLHKETLSRLEKVESRGRNKAKA